MSAIDDPFKPWPTTSATGSLLDPVARGGAPGPSASIGTAGGAVTARLHGFDMQSLPVLAGLPHFPDQLVAARTTVPLHRSQLGSMVLVLHEDGDWTRPIVVGVLQEPSGEQQPSAQPLVEVQVDKERMTLSAEREIVLRCGDASITLTRAGKVVIKGNYIVSRSTGYNRIKGAAVDIN